MGDNWVSFLFGESSLDRKIRLFADERKVWSLGSHTSEPPPLYDFSSPILAATYGNLHTASCTHTAKFPPTKLYESFPTKGILVLVGQLHTRKRRFRYFFSNAFAKCRQTETYLISCHFAPSVDFILYQLLYVLLISCILLFSHLLKINKK